MTLHILDDYVAMSEATADLIQNYVNEKPKSIICIASGSTPLGLCKVLASRVKNGEIDLTEATFVALDEWLGMGPDDEGSCQHFLKVNLFEPLNIQQNKIIQFDAKSNDLETECDKLNLFITKNHGLDIIVVGVGMNGHIGLNEPGTPFDIYAHVSKLADITKSVGQKYFTSETPLNYGITLGLKQVMDAKLPVLIASGESKADIIAQSLTVRTNEDLPSSLFKELPHAVVILDRDAAKMLTEDVVNKFSI